MIRRTLAALAAAALILTPTAAHAKHGADDPAGHCRHACDDGPGHH